VLTVFLSAAFLYVLLIFGYVIWSLLGILASFTGPAAATGYTAAALIPIAGLVVRRATARRRLTAWAERTGWSLSPGGSDLARSLRSRLPGEVDNDIRLTVSGTVRGVPVTVAQVAWTDSLDGGPDGSSTGGAALFVVARLPHAYPQVAVEHRDRRRRRGKDAFDRRFRVVSSDPGAAERLIGPALRRAHLAGKVPPWSIAGDELLARVNGSYLPRPAKVVKAADSALRIIDLFGIDHDRPDEPDRQDTARA
jgi:hypothetical protein